MKEKTEKLLRKIHYRIHQYFHEKTVTKLNKIKRLSLKNLKYQTCCWLTTRSPSDVIAGHVKENK